MSAARSRRGAPGLVSGVVLGLAVGLVLATLIAGCVVHRVAGPRLTGTCDGACAHYVACKGGATTDERARCQAECPDVFSDRDSLMAYESLACPDAIEFVDGAGRATAAR